MDAGDRALQLSRRSPSEYGSEDDDRESPEEMALSKLNGRDPNNAPLVRLDGASDLLKQMRLMQREQECRQVEKEVRHRTEEVLQRERQRLEEDIRAEREEARWRREAEDKAAAERERKAMEWEERVLADVMQREEKLRAREKDFMAHWERERLLAQERALRHEKNVMATDLKIQVLAKLVAEGVQRRRMQDIKDLVLILAAFGIFSAMLLYKIL